MTGNTIINLILSFVILILLLFNFPSQYSLADTTPCIHPYEDMVISRNTKLCQGEYFLPDHNKNGAISISADNVSLKCNETIIFGDSITPSSKGVIDNSYDGLTIEGCTFKGYSSAIYLNDASDITIQNNQFLENYSVLSSPGNSISGIGLRNSLIHDNIFQRNDGSCSIFLHNASENKLSDNIFESNYIGICLHNNVDHIIIDSNDFSSNSFALIIKGSDISYNKIISNTFFANSSGIYIYSNKDIWEIAIEQNNFKSNSISLQIEGSQMPSDILDVKLTENTLNANFYGILIKNAPEVEVYHNNFLYNEIQATSNVPLEFNNEFNQGNFWVETKFPGLDLIDSNCDGIYDSGDDFPYQLSAYIFDNGPYVDRDGWNRTGPVIRCKNIAIE